MTNVLTIVAQSTVDVPGLILSFAAPAGSSILLAVAVVLAAVGIWLMLPPKSQRAHFFGGIVAFSGFALLAGQFIQLGPWHGQMLFWLLSGITVVSAVATISMRSPVYSAIWFALTLLGTAGLFLLQDAQFLSVATIIVYAGAILVTFLFVLMLAQPEGQAYYDRISWGPLVPTFGASCTAAIVFGLTCVLVELQPPDFAGQAITGDHMAQLGAELFSRHLISVEVAGTLLLVALVGAIAMVIHSHDTPSKAAPDHNKGETGNG